MGNTQSTKNDIKNLQEALCELGFVSNEKIPLGGPFYIEAQPPKDGIYEYRIYHLNRVGFWTKFFSFELFHPLRNKFEIMYDGSIVKFFFETDSFEKGLKHILEYSFYFSMSFRSENESFRSENDFSGSLKSIPFLIRQDRNIIFLNGEYWYYVISVDATHHQFYIVESSDVSKRGFESTFKSGDTVIEKINVESSTLPYVSNDSEGNLVIASADEGFVQIQIKLPDDLLTLTEMLGEKIPNA